MDFCILNDKYIKKLQNVEINVNSPVFDKIVYKIENGKIVNNKILIKDNIFYWFYFVKENNFIYICYLKSQDGLSWHGCNNTIDNIKNVVLKLNTQYINIFIDNKNNFNIIYTLLDKKNRVKYGIFTSDDGDSWSVKNTDIGLIDSIGLIHDIIWDNKEKYTVYFSNDIQFHENSIVSGINLYSCEIFELKDIKSALDSKKLIVETKDRIYNAISFNFIDVNMYIFNLYSNLNIYLYIDSKLSSQVYKYYENIMPILGGIVKSIDSYDYSYMSIESNCLIMARNIQGRIVNLSSLHNKPGVIETSLIQFSESMKLFINTEVISDIYVSLKHEDNKIYENYLFNSSINNYIIIHSPEVLKLSFEINNNKIYSFSLNEDISSSFIYNNLAKVAVCLSCHKSYIHFLKSLIPQIDDQGEIGCKILAYDGNLGDLEGLVGNDWTILNGKYGGPSPGRNAGLDFALKNNCDFIVYFDADNIMHSGYIIELIKTMLIADDNCAVVYPEIQYLYQNGNTRLLNIPEYDSIKLFDNNYIDTASCWRIASIHEIGGWKILPCLEDWDLACRLINAGWTAKKSDAVLTMRQGHDNRTARALTDIDKKLESLWSFRRLAVVSLLAGRQTTFEIWKNWILNADIPDYTSLYIVDNSRDRKFGQDLSKFLTSLGGRYKEIHLFTDDREPLSSSEEDIYRHIGLLYNIVFGKIGTEPLIMTLEDDVEPPINAIKLLHSQMQDNKTIGAVGGVYRCPHSINLACAAYSFDKWENCPGFESVKGINQCGFIGGGCTLYKTSAVKSSLPLVTTIKPNLLGWDANLSMKIRSLGYKILLDGNVYCKHHIHGVIK